MAAIQSSREYKGFREGDTVLRKGRLCTISKINWLLNPPDVTVKMHDTGDEVGTEFSRLSKITDPDEHIDDESDAQLLQPSKPTVSDANTSQQSYTIWKAVTSIKESTLSASTKSKKRLSMEGQLKQARISLERYRRIPRWVIKRAKGLVFLTVIKAGFLFAGNVGTGVVIARQANGRWSGPSSVGVAGVSFGFLAGASKVEYIMILPDDKAVKQFTGKGQLRLGGDIQLAVGPIGRDGSGSVGASVVYSYSHCQGLYGGLALEGKAIAVRPDCNKAFYKRTVQCDEILNGKIEDIPSNEDYDKIVHILDSYCLGDDKAAIKGNKQEDNEEKKENEKQDLLIFD
eukprot:233479_1